jgi:hypothetical protein
MPATRTADLGRLALGAGLLAHPELAVRLTGSPDGKGVRRTVRILGARYVVQSVGGSLVDRSWVRAADTAVDLVHAVSMVGFARAFPEHRRMSLVSAGLALAFAGLDVTEPVR